MHIIINDEIFNGLKIMKYSVNHYWKFSNPIMAFAAGFLQVSAMLTITIINYMVIYFSSSVLDIAKDFTALIEIAKFDDMFADTLDTEKVREVL